MTSVERSGLLHRADPEDFRLHTVLLLAELENRIKALETQMAKVLKRLP